MSAYGDGGGWTVMPGKGLVKIPIWNPKLRPAARPDPDPWIIAASKLTTQAIATARLRSEERDPSAAALADRFDRDAERMVEALVAELSSAIDQAGIDRFFDDYCGSRPKPWPWPPVGRVKAEQIASFILDVTTEMPSGRARDAALRSAMAQVEASLG